MGGQGRPLHEQRLRPVWVVLIVPVHDHRNPGANDHPIEALGLQSSVISGTKHPNMVGVKFWRWIHNSSTRLAGPTQYKLPHHGNASHWDYDHRDSPSGQLCGGNPTCHCCQPATGRPVLLFLADYHALIKNRDPALVRRSSLEVAATWLALGLDTSRSIFYRQSDIPELPELTWILTTVTAKGLMNRSHAYKAAVQANVQSGDTDPDKAITMGLFSYPILMAADILMFKAQRVPVGRDQKQHVEMARDIAQRFNHLYGEHFVSPEADIGTNTAFLTGLDGRKMSKSYGNSIPLFSTSAQLRRLIMRIKTNSLEPGVPKETSSSVLFEMYQAFATPADTQVMAKRYASGAGWGN